MKTSLYFVSVFCVINYKFAFNTMRMLKPEHLSISYGAGYFAYNSFVRSLKRRVVPTPNSMYSKKTSSLEDFKDLSPLVTLIYASFPSQVDCYPMLNNDYFDTVFVNLATPKDFAKMLNFAYFLRTNIVFTKLKQRNREQFTEIYTKNDIKLFDYCKIRETFPKFSKALLKLKSIKLEKVREIISFYFKKLTYDEKKLEEILKNINPNKHERVMNFVVEEIIKFYKVSDEDFIIKIAKLCFDENENSIKERSKSYVDDFSLQIPYGSSLDMIEYMNIISKYYMDKFIFDNSLDARSEFYLNILRVALIDDFYNDLPEKMPEMVISACINQKFNDRKHMIEIYSNLSDGYFADNDKEKALNDIEKFEYSPNFEFEINNINDALERYFLDIMKLNPSPYFFVNPFETGNAIQYKEGKKDEFPSCTETTIRHLLNCILYDLNEYDFCLDNLNGELKNFFSDIQTISKINYDDAEGINTTWADLIKNIPGIVSYVKRGYEAKSSILNIYNILAHFIGQPQKSEIKKEDFVKGIIYFASLINPKQKLVSTDDPYTVEGFEVFPFKIKGATWSFELRVRDAKKFDHAFFNITEPDISGVHVDEKLKELEWFPYNNNPTIFQLLKFSFNQDAKFELRRWTEDVRLNQFLGIALNIFFKKNETVDLSDFNPKEPLSIVIKKDSLVKKISLSNCSNIVIIDYTNLKKSITINNNQPGSSPSFELNIPRIERLNVLSPTNLKINSKVIDELEIWQTLGDNFSVANTKIRRLVVKGKMWPLKNVKMIERIDFVVFSQELINKALEYRVKHLVLTLPLTSVNSAFIVPIDYEIDYLQLNNFGDKCKSIQLRPGNGITSIEHLMLNKCTNLVAENFSFHHLEIQNCQFSANQLYNLLASPFKIITLNSDLMIDVENIYQNVEEMYLFLQKTFSTDFSKFKNLKKLKIKFTSFVDSFVFPDSLVELSLVGKFYGENTVMGKVNKLETLIDNLPSLTVENEIKELRIICEDYTSEFIAFVMDVNEQLPHWRALINVCFVSNSDRQIDLLKKLVSTEVRYKVTIIKEETDM